MRVKDILKDAFSLKNDTASHEEIKRRIVDGGQITGSSELLARTEPTIWDVIIALSGGIAGIFSLNLPL